MNWSGTCCALWLLLQSSGTLTHIRDNTWFGKMIGIDAMSALAMGRLLARDYSCYISVSLLRKGHWFSRLGMSFYLIYFQAGTDVVALWLICGRPGNVTCMAYAVVVFNQLQMFPVKPAKLFCAPW